MTAGRSAVGFASGLRESAWVRRCVAESQSIPGFPAPCRLCPQQFQQSSYAHWCCGPPPHHLKRDVETGPEWFLFKFTLPNFPSAPSTTHRAPTQARGTEQERPKNHGSFPLSAVTAAAAHQHISLALQLLPQKLKPDLPTSTSRPTAPWPLPPSSPPRTEISGSSALSTKPHRHLHPALNLGPHIAFLARAHYQTDFDRLTTEPAHRLRDHHLRILIPLSGTPRHTKTKPHR